MGKPTVYSETPFSYFQKHDMTLEEAEDLFDSFFKNKPMIEKFIEDVHEQVKKDGFVTCLHGFRRNLRDVYSQEKSKQNGALRQSVNTMIQGSGAHLTNMSLYLIDRVFKDRNMETEVVMTVHDSIVLDCPRGEVTEATKIARIVMENLPVSWLFIEWNGEQMRYPIKADVEIGTNYNDLVEFDAEDFKKFDTSKGYCDFHNAINSIIDHFESGTITEEKKDELVQKIESSKNLYQNQLVS